MHPRLLINKELWDWKAVSLSGQFVSLVYPAVLREILSVILVEDKYFDVDDPLYRGDAARVVRRVERDAGGRPGLTTEERQRLEQLERENVELRRANEILRLASAYFAKADLDRRAK